MDKAAVLLLERNATIIDIARECFAADDVELHVANSVDLAVRIAARRKLVVAVLDATMAGAVPGETVMKLKGFHHALRIVFLADPGVNIDRRHSQLGMVLRKPFTAERFGDTVRSALRLQSMSAGVQRMRHSSGTFPAISANEAPPGGLPTLTASTPPTGVGALTSMTPPAGMRRVSPSTPPMGIRGLSSTTSSGVRGLGSTPPPPMPGAHAPNGLPTEEKEREDDAAARRFSDRKPPIPREEPPDPPDPPRSLTPRPFARVR
jgi:hypothetical protein